MTTDMLQYLDPDGLDETALNIGQIKTSLEAEMQDLPYARPDGIYPDMTVGAVIGADGTAQWAQRESTGSGAATVRSVQGAAVVWKQWRKPTDGSATGTYSGVSYVRNADGSVKVGGTASGAQANIYPYVFQAGELIIGHKYLIRGCSPAGGSSTTYFGGIGGSSHDLGNGHIWTNVSTTAGTQLRICVRDGATIPETTLWPQFFDLTAMFGAGNEPTTVAEFERMYPEAYYPYSAPTLTPVRIAGIASTDANGDALDGVEWETQTLRAAGSVADVLYSDHVDVKVGVVDLGTFEWSWQASWAAWYTAFIDINAAVPPINVAANVSHATLQGITQSNATWSGYTGTGIAFSANTADPTKYRIIVKNGSDSVQPSGLMFYELATPTTTPISPALPMTYRVEQGGSESIIVPDGEVSAAPVLTVAEPVNMSTELARIWEAIQSLGYTRNAAQLSRPISLTDVGSVDEVQKDTTEIETTKEVQE